MSHTPFLPYFSFCSSLFFSEAPNAEAIANARLAARQWLEVERAERAEVSLSRVSQYVSHSSDLGAAFHIEHAQALEACGKGLAARRMLQRVSAEATSSTLRWQAERALERAMGVQPRRDGQNEMGSLFQMPQNWD
jgi:hypothetical protein